MKNHMGEEICPITHIPLSRKVDFTGIDTQGCTKRQELPAAGLIDDPAYNITFDPSMFCVSKDHILDVNYSTKTLTVHIDQAKINILAPEWSVQCRNNCDVNAPSNTRITTGHHCRVYVEDSCHVDTGESCLVTAKSHCEVKSGDHSHWCIKGSHSTFSGGLCTGQLVWE